MCCDEQLWSKVGFQFEKCIERTENELFSIEEPNSIESQYSASYCRYETIEYG